VTLLDRDYRVRQVAMLGGATAHAVELVTDDEVEHLRAMPDAESAQAMKGYLRLARAALAAAWAIADNPESWRQVAREVYDR
jgi:hypothetical protein